MVNATTPTPFFSRAYGGFTHAQELYFLDILGSLPGKTILDPMAGQGFALSNLARQGATIWLGDLDPAPLLLAHLRNPRLVLHSSQYSEWLMSVIARLSRRRSNRSTSNRFVNTWLAPEIARGLIEYSSLIGLGLFANPYVSESGFWTGDEFTQFATAIAVLAARDLTCFRQTDNLTWLKPGGLLRETQLHRSLQSALERWRAYCATCHASIQAPPYGGLHIQPMSVEHGEFGSAPKPSWIITSPPYANRLDYSRMWAPEISVLSTMCNTTLERLRVEHIGTNVVEHITVAKQEEQALPKKVRDALRQIRDDSADYSRVYYYPFFRNYAVSLMRSLKHLAQRLRVGGKLLIFVRDTVRKDVRFPTGELVRTILTSKECGLTCVREERKVIRHHIGFLRKASSRGVYGLAQVEWWLMFAKHRSGDENGRAR